MSSRKKQQLSFHVVDDTMFVSLDDMEIWDGADLSLLRDILARLVNEDGYLSIGVDLAAVKYIPSGFFGMLFEWYESGIAIRLRSPQQHVAEMLWFRMFFLPESGDEWRLCDAGVRDHSPNEQVEHHRRMFLESDDDDTLLDPTYESNFPSAQLG